MVVWSNGDLCHIRLAFWAAQKIGEIAGGGFNLGILGGSTAVVLRKQTVEPRRPSGGGNWPDVPPQ